MVKDKYDESELNQKPTHIFNVDETGFSGDQGNQLIICKRGTKTPCLVSGNASKVHYTVNFCCNAAGQYLPPFIVYKAKSRLMEEWCTEGPDDAVYTISPSGWMETDQFMQWFTVVFIAFTSHLIGPKILFLDGHASHVSIELINLAIKNNIDLLCLPSHSTHILQPLDVGVFSVVKGIWKKNLREFYLNSGSDNVTKNNFPSLLNKLYDDAFKPQHAVGGFYKCGLYPLDQNKLDFEFLELTKPFQLETVQAPSSITISKVLTSPQAQIIETVPNDPEILLSPVEKASKILSSSLLKHLNLNLANKKKTPQRGIKVSGKCMTGRFFFYK